MQQQNLKPPGCEVHLTTEQLRDETFNSSAEYASSATRPATYPAKP